MGAAGLLIGGAVGMEMIAGKVHQTLGYASVTFAAVSQLEEVLEMVGVIVFVHALLTYARSHLGEPMRLPGGRTICFDDSPHDKPTKPETESRKSKRWRTTAKNRTYTRSR